MISVIIPLYNKEPIIERSLQSVLTQDFDDFEVVVVNDGSTDRSAEIVREIKDSRITLIDQENGGPSKARNTGVKHSKGEWIVFLDADDELLPGALKHFSKLSEEHRTIEFFACSSYYCCKEEKHEPFKFKEGLLKNPYATLFLHYYSPRTGNFMCSKRVAKECPFNERIRRYEDLECFFRMYKKTKIYLSCTPVLVENRDYTEASRARKDISEDFLGHLDFKGKTFWEKMCLYKLFIEERELYAKDVREKHRNLYYRFDLMLCYKMANILNSNVLTRALLNQMIYRTLQGGNSGVCA